ncbi:hypothetical protein [Clostridium polynesiense]|uniref:hypothetical protein n=1 Tax=Clostridium polynesiense TaxID=1325933 RepID=UPI00058DC450|nr:hypothetical protein [Clostridium polynesiense]
MKLYAQIEEGKDKDKFILENTKLEVNPIGCREYDKGAEYIKENLYSKNFQFGIRPNERFEQLMAFKYTKFLSENKNIKINRVDNINSLYKIKSLKSLQGTDGDNRVLVDYNTLEQCFSQWFNVTFKLNSKTEGEFIVSY